MLLFLFDRQKGQSRLKQKETLLMLQVEKGIWKEERFLSWY